MNLPVYFQRLQSPVGELRLAASDEGLVAIAFPENRHPLPKQADWVEGTHAVLDEAARQLQDYFAGKRRHFNLPLAAQGTEFQRMVWSALREIPFGETWSYADVAHHIGRPTATRAVGAANGRNPVPIVVPCHRVIGRDGSLTGFSGGMAIKQHLLALESGERLL